MGKCKYCATEDAVDGWVWCRQCWEKSAAASDADRRRRIKEETQTPGTRSARKTLNDGDADEQLGIHSRMVRLLEDGA